jgi:hypothetical protein
MGRSERSRACCAMRSMSRPRGWSRA